MTSCTWPVDRTALPDPSAEEDQAALQEAIDTAVGVLWAFTGRRYSCCPRVIRPCPTEREGVGAWSMSWLHQLGGLDPRDWWEVVLCGCGPRCEASGPGVIHLPGQPCSVEAVTVAGVELDPAEYTLEGDRLYARSGRWPTQDLRRPDGDPGTWSVRYLEGIPPPAGAARMVALLAKEFLAVGTEKCKLPSTVETVSRRGLSMRMAPAEKLFPDQRTGIKSVDLWIAAHNPHGHTTPGVVSSPDYPAGGGI